VVVLATAALAAGAAVSGVAVLATATPAGEVAREVADCDSGVEIVAARPTPRRERPGRWRGREGFPAVRCSRPPPPWSTTVSVSNPITSSMRPLCYPLALVGAIQG